jgi:NAD(P)-dependent dehydrogenase (short-subunit alcohol dehydrogenase family)
MTYGMAKAAVNRMTTYIAEEVREYGIAVNALIPGIVRTPGYENSLPKNFDPQKEGVEAYPSSPEVFFEPVTFLASETAEGLTGQVVHNMEYGKTWP